MVRPTVHLLVIMMLLASGRLLACGLECLDELAAPEVASCHTESAPATAISGDAAHACLPDVAEPLVRVVKTLDLAAAPLAAPHLAPAPPSFQLHRLAALFRTRPDAPHLSAPPVLRI
ncbi:MAG: hypothetical protein Q8O42_11170 [Acidobacteriota bacterium]|nr:hypothetical protein [Acidobacteriota bacterium]